MGMDIRTGGYAIDFIETPIHLSFSKDCVMSIYMSVLCDSEVCDLLLKKAIVSIPKLPNGFVSNMFDIKKTIKGPADPVIQAHY